ncbi:MAG: HD domain-containing protein [Acidimicrobiia bacterium]|nr:HD domain-containing protein [Acidimicrobiia bacterium]
MKTHRRPDDLRRVDFVDNGVSTTETEVRAAELTAVCCLATDLGMGFPFEHGLHATLMTRRLASLLDVDETTASQSFYASLLMYAGCTADTAFTQGILGGRALDHITPAQFGSPVEGISGAIHALSPPDAPFYQRFFATMRGLPKVATHHKSHFSTLCEVSEIMAERLGMPPSVSRLFPLLTERWDGKGILKRATGDDIPLSLRIVHVARDAAFQALVFGVDRAVEVVRERGGHAFDPEIAETFAKDAHEILAMADTSESVWEETLAAEPKPHLLLNGDEIDRSLAATGDFSDLSSPYLSGHSRGVAELVTIAAESLRLEPDEKVLVRRAAQLHDVGRAGISPKIWEKPGSLSADEWEQIRMHAYYTERVLTRSRFLSPLVDMACGHHERLDGTGYHRGSTARSLSPGARLLAAADTFHAMTEPRPYRSAMSADQAAETVADEAEAGRLDPQMVKAVVEAAGEPSPAVELPSGLTEREAEIVGLLARGLQTKQMARALGISNKTADHHIQNAYRKMGVSTRAAATLFAMDHGLVSWSDTVEAKAL